MVIETFKVPSSNNVYIINLCNTNYYVSIYVIIVL